MFDTTNIYQYANMGYENYMRDFLPYINYPSEHTDHKGNVWISGGVKNYKLTASKTQIYLKGSISKFGLNDNFQVLGRSDTEKAVLEFSDLLHTDISIFQVSRLDIGQNFILNNPIENYLNYFGQSQYYKKLDQDTGIEYRNNIKSLAFYDKIKEVGKDFIPDCFKNNNVLRYELRIKKRLSRQLKDYITVAQIYDEQFYRKLIDLWYKEFKQIDKQNIMKTTFSNIKAANPADIINILAAERINEIGQNNVLKIIDELKARNVFSRPEYVSRAKNQIKKLANSLNYSEQPELIKELDNEVQKVLKYYR